MAKAGSSTMDLIIREVAERHGLPENLTGWKGIMGRHPMFWDSSSHEYKVSGLAGNRDARIAFCRHGAVAVTVVRNPWDR